MKKRGKFWFIVLVILVVILLICAFLFRIWVMPSWIVPNCYEICEWNCKRGSYVMCQNKCITKCVTPRLKRCTKKCELPEEIEWKYNYENYDIWRENRRGGNKWFASNFSTKCAILGECSWKDDLEYKWWINEEFGWYKNEIEEYESCIQSCDDKYPDMLLRN